MGGWGKAGDFDSIVRSEEARLQFSENSIAFCRQHGFDGVDLGFYQINKKRFFIEKWWLI